MNCTNVKQGVTEKEHMCSVNPPQINKVKKMLPLSRFNWIMVQFQVSTDSNSARPVFLHREAPLADQKKEKSPIEDVQP